MNSDNTIDKYYELYNIIKNHRVSIVDNNTCDTPFFKPILDRDTCKVCTIAEALYR